MFNLLRYQAGIMNVRTVIVIVLICLFALFLLQNSADVDIRFLFWKLTMPRVILLILAGLAGCAVGVLVGWEIFGKKR